jgi:hypothetical protein
MLVTVALLCMPLIALALRAWRGDIGWRETLLAASVLWGTYLTAVCEVLGALKLLTAPWLIACWAALALALEAYLFWHVWRGNGREPLLAKATWRHVWTRLSWPLWAALGGLGVILALTFVTALAAPPNTPDTMTYHLPRVMRWIQDASLAPFPTHYLSQNIQPPWAEYTLLNLHLLSGGDSLDGLLQWGCFAGSMVGVSLIAARLGAGARGQILAALYAATIPMAVIQASSAQNDLVVAYWLVCMVYFLLAYRAASNPPARIRAAALAGLSLGLAALTKGVAYVDALPFLLVFAWWAIRALRWRAWRPFVALAVLALAVNFGFFARNLIVFHAPLGPQEATRAFSNATYTPDVLALNLARNLAVEFGGPIHVTNALVTHGTDSLLRVVGLDPNDPRATMAGSPLFQVRGEKDLWLSDGYTTNTIHLLIVLLASVACLALAALRRRTLGYLLALVGAFIVFSLYLRWQAGSNRIMLGLFVLAAPLAGVAAEALAQHLRLRSRVTSAAFMTSLLVMLILSAAPRLLLAQSRPLVGSDSILVTPRIDQYFAVYGTSVERGYVRAVNSIRASGCHQIGYLVSGPQDRAGYTSGAPALEYQLWALLGETGGGSYQVEDVLVTNQTAPLASTEPYTRFQPCAVFAILEPAALQQTRAIGGHNFRLDWHEQSFVTASIAVYMPDGSA